MTTGVDESIDPCGIFLFPFLVLVHMLFRQGGAQSLMLAPEFAAESGGAPQPVLLCDYGLECHRDALGAQDFEQGRGQGLHDQHLVVEVLALRRGAFDPVEQGAERFMIILPRHGERVQPQAAGDRADLRKLFTLKIKQQQLRHDILRCV